MATTKKEFNKEIININMRLSGVVVSTSDYESTEPSSVPDEGSRRTFIQVFIFPNGLVDKWEGKLWKLGCHSGPVTWRNGLLSTTGSKAYVTGDERRSHSTRSYSVCPRFTLQTMFGGLICYIVF